jgi:hypothetical protein
MIVKIQRSLSEPGRVLIYPQDRTFVLEGPELFDGVRAVLGDDLKVYAEGHLDGLGQFVVERRVADQPW